MKSINMFINKKFLLLTLAVLVVFTLSACSSSTDDTNGDDTNGDVLVTSIQLTSAGNLTTVSLSEGTLQMSATVLPSNATDSSYTWSVVNGTGAATISTTGLLTLESSGTVTVNATSVSTPSISASKVITIYEGDVSLDATLTQLEIDGMSILGFSPLVYDYVHVLSSGETQTPTITAVKYESSSSIDITDATDVTSSNSVDRTTVITVTTTDEDQKIYRIVFEISPDGINLGTAADFVMLAESGISTEPTSVITGDVGLSPQAASYFTGFSETMHSSGEYALSDQVTGKLYASDYTSPTPSKLTTAVADMVIAYDEAAGRTANYTELYSGDLSGKTLTSGVFKFGNSVLINTDLTLNGSATDVWIFQISGNLTMASNMNIILEGGAQAENIYWQVADTVALGSGAHFEGTILAKTNISVNTGASINGHLYAQTAITLNSATVTKTIE